MRLFCSSNQEFLESSLEPVRMVLSDPPWGAGVQNKGTPYVFEDPPEMRDEIINRLVGYSVRCAKVALVACDDRWLPDWHIAFRANGWTSSTIVCESALGNPGKKRWPIKHYYWVAAHAGEYPEVFNVEALPLEERRARLGSGEVKRVAGVIRTTMSNTDPERVIGWQAQKPVWLLESFIEAYTQPGETVCDPFTGTGSTGIAAHQKGREFIGYEQNEQSFQMAWERLSAIR